MNQRIKECLAVAAILAYALICATAAFGHDSAQPHSHASQIVVSTTAFNNITGITNNNQSNVTLQVVLDAMDNSTLPTASNIVVNTNNFDYFAPTNPTLQVLLDWQDDHSYTNIDNTNIYMTSVQSSNAFVSTGTTAFIRDETGRVTADNITNGTIGIDEIETSYMKMVRIAGYNAQGGDAICASCGSAVVGVVTTTQVTRSTLFGLYAYLAMTNVSTPSSDPLSLMYVSAQISSNGTVWQTVDSSAATVSYSTNTAGVAINSSAPAQLHWFVPASNYYKVEATAATSLQPHQRWTCLWQRTYSIPTGP